ncbi:RDS1 [Acrasis kona]|uniref:RDS1 n=1 Tax=Acrasis kona TaxID=1008807 RepID=A0AAW2YX00_9EUKA
MYKSIFLVAFIAMLATAICQSMAPTTTPTCAPKTTAEQENLKPNLQVLNYALTLEHLEAAFYREGLKQFTEQDVMNAGYSAQVREYVSTIAQHEAVHVSTLTTVIQGLCGVPVQECKYDFGYGNNFTTFLQVASALENTGVSAYDGAAQMITIKSYLTAAATIATVEGRHAAYLNFLVGMMPYPQAFDTPLNMTQVLAIASPFIVSCPAVNNQCNGVAATNSGVCSGNGVCSFTVCTCNTGFQGLDCNSTSSAVPSCPSQSTTVPPNNESGDDNSRSGAAQVVGSLLGVGAAAFAALFV